MAREHRSLVAARRQLVSRLAHSELARHLGAMLVPGPAVGRSLLYSTRGNLPLLDVLARSRRFCRDTAVGGMLHPARISFREVRRRPGLHITLEPYDRISVHVDHETPAVGRKADGSCRYTSLRTLRHIWRDVLPPPHSSMDHHGASSRHRRRYVHEAGVHMPHLRRRSSRLLPAPGPVSTAPAGSRIRPARPVGEAQRGGAQRRGPPPDPATAVRTPGPGFPRSSLREEVVLPSVRTPI